VLRHPALGRHFQAAMSSTFLLLSASPRKKPEPMTVSTSDLTTGLARVQIKLLVDFKLLRTYSNGLGVGKLLRVDLSDNQGLMVTYLNPSDLLRIFQAASQLLLSLTSPPAWIQFCM
jgi:hypothetical protein